MTLVYEYTPSVPDASPAGTVFDTGRTGTTQRAAPTTQEGVWDALRTALLAAGWTENNLATRDSVFYSTGESGLENISIRLVFVAGTTAYLHFQIAPKRDASNNLEGAIGFSSSSLGTAADRWGIATAASFEFQIRADLDSIWAIFQAGTSGIVYSVFLGRLIRTGVGVNSAVYANSSAITAGRFVTVAMAGGADPLADGWTPGDSCQLVEVDPNTGPAAEVAIVADVTSTELVFARLANSYTTARIGQLASPLFRWVGQNIDLGTTDQWTSPFLWSGPADDDLQGNVGGGEVSGNRVPFNLQWAVSGGVAAPSPLSGNTVSGEFGFNSAPNASNLRFLGRAGVMVSPSAAADDAPGGKFGRVPGLWALWRFNTPPALYPHDWLDDQRASPVVQVTPFRTLSTSLNFYGLGPMPL